MCVKTAVIKYHLNWCVTVRDQSLISQGCQQGLFPTGLWSFPLFYAS